MLIVLLAAVLTAGCASPKIAKPSPSANQEAALRNPPVENYPTPAIRSEGSLFSDDSRLDLFADMKARRVGDVITITITETSRANKTAATTLDRSNALTGEVNTILGQGAGNVGGLGRMFNLDVSSDMSFSGSGSTNRNESMTARMTARVIQVLPNGNLVVRGSQEIMVNNEKQYITVQGVVRPSDIGADNSVLSYRIADARIDYTGEGDVSSKQREGWLSRFFNVVWPF
jgi:flagellar L-ring protein precursor FlgH